jgi:hypothetical protein
MENNLIKILKEFETLKGQHIISDMFKIAIGEDDMDYYYVTFDGRNINWNTCVGRIMPLKGQLRDDYNYIVHIAKLNHTDQLILNEFLKLVDEDIKKYTECERFLTKLCWELN